jgi:hypothetical protein
MTANATISVQTAKNALVVPLQALSFRPDAGTFHRGAHKTFASTNGAATSASPWGQTAAGANGSAAAGSTGLLFVQRNGKPAPVRVHIDLVSGAQAAVTPLRGTLQEGDNAIVSSGQSQAHAAQSASGGSRGGYGGPGGMNGIGRALR